MATKQGGSDTSKLQKESNYELVQQMRWKWDFNVVRGNRAGYCFVFDSLLMS